MGQEKNPLVRHGGLSYLEIPTSDPRRSGAFYESVLGWKIDPRSESDYRFSDGDGLLIGRFVMGRAPSEPGFVPFLYVEGIDAAVERVTENEGEGVSPITLEGDTRIARVRDPSGNLIGLWQFDR